jgi:hypothetical protein
MTTGVVFGPILGGVAGWLPAWTFVVASYCSSAHRDPREVSIPAFAMLMIYVPIGVVCGLIGGILYGLKQRLLTAASLCVGVLGGGVLTMGVYGMEAHKLASENSEHWGLYLHIAGVLLGILCTVFSWRRASR